MTQEELPEGENNNESSSNKLKKKRDRDRNKRPSPSVSATTQELNTEMQGNDGNTYIVKADKNGIHRWQKKK